MQAMAKDPANRLSVADLSKHLLISTQVARPMLRVSDMMCCQALFIWLIPIDLTTQDCASSAAHELSHLLERIISHNTLQLWVHLNDMSSSKRLD